MATAAEHKERAEEFLERADTWLDPEITEDGWEIGSARRSELCTRDLLRAIVHSNLARCTDDEA